MSDYCPVDPKTGFKKSPWIIPPVRQKCSYKDDARDWLRERPSGDLIIFDLSAQLPIGVVTDPNRDVFYELASQWKRETWFLSSVRKRMNHLAYWKIIGMGKDALPYIFEALRAEPDHWFGALEAITRESPAPDAQNMYELRDAWLRWAASHDY